MNARSFDIDLKRLKSWNDAQNLPGLDLKETALYFLHLLSEEDLARLEKTMKILDGCEIKVGTACSGTDITVSVTKATFAALSEYFGVPYLKHVLFATYTIYIGFVCICQQSWQASFACNIHDIYIYIIFEICTKFNR